MLFISMNIKKLEEHFEKLNIAHILTTVIISF